MAYTYLINADFLLQIQDVNLQQIINNDQNVLELAKQAAQAEATSYLKQKYMLMSEFTPTMMWSNSVSYKAGDRVYLDAPAFSALSTYAINSLVLYLGDIYICTVAVVAAGAFNPANWTLLGKHYQLFYVTTPYSVFNYLNIYNIGDIVFWNGKIYTSKKATSYISHEAELQIGEIINPKIVNIFPDDPKNGIQYWGVGVPYSILAGTRPTDTTKWTVGDNRDPKMVMTLIDIVLYHIHCRIAPRNIPELRNVRYNGSVEDRINAKSRILYPTYSALGWLQSIADGEDITPELQQIQPKSGARIRHGGSPKNINQY